MKRETNKNLSRSKRHRIHDDEVRMRKEHRAKRVRDGIQMTKSLLAIARALHEFGLGPFG